MFRGTVPFASLLLLTLLTSACASTGAVPHPFPAPGGWAATPSRETPSSSAAAYAPPRPVAAPRLDGYAVTGTALSLRGTPYRNGGIDPKSGFDCSGFTQYVFSQHGLSLPREVRDQYRSGKEVRPEQLVAGDLLFFSTTAPGATHVGIAIGDDAFIHAPSSTGVVRVERLSASYWSQRFLGARRVN